MYQACELVTVRSLVDDPVLVGDGVSRGLCSLSSAGRAGVFCEGSGSGSGSF